MKKVTIKSEIFYPENKTKNLINALLELKNNEVEIFVDDIFRVENKLIELLKNEDIILKQSNDSDYAKKFIDINNFSREVGLFLLNSRNVELIRNTNETKVKVLINLDGKGDCKINTGIGFFNHMLEQVARHGNIDLVINTDGDLEVDEHHTVEDVGIALGEAVLKALGNKTGIKRYGFLLPMDDSIAKCAIDLGGRSYLNFNVKFKRETVGDFPTELTEEFFRGVANGMKANIFIRAKGKNDHHKIEAIFKSFARALNEACRIDERNPGIIPSTKGVL